MAATPLGAAATAAVTSALQREHGGIRLNIALVTPLVAYFSGRGEAVTELPLDYPLRGTEDFERRWLAKLRAAGVTDEGDQVDFLLWTKARAAPSSAGGAATATGLARVALLALEAAGDRPSVAGLTNMERALAVGEAGEEEQQCCNSVVAYNLIWGRDPTASETDTWDRQKASLGSRDGGRIDLTSDEKYGKLQKSSELIGRVTLRRALRSSTQHMFEDWKVDLGDQLHAKNLPKAAARLDKVVAFAIKQAHHVWEAQREYLEGYFFKEFLGLGLPKVIAPASALICAGSPVVLASRMRMQPASLQTQFSSGLGGSTTSTLSIPGCGSGSSWSGDVGPSASQLSAEVAAAAERLFNQAMQKQTSFQQASFHPSGLNGSANGGDAFADRKDNSGRCKFCMRLECLYITGGKPCREYHQALNYLGEQRASRRKARDDKDKDKEMIE